MLNSSFFIILIYLCFINGTHNGFINTSSTLLFMSREMYQKTGLIIALVIAGISMSTSIVSFMREPVINNNYENNYYVYYNQTYYDGDETNYTKPLERVDYYNYDQYDCIIRNFTLSSSFAYWYYWNASATFTLRLYVTFGFFYDNIVVLNGTIQCIQYLDKIHVHQRGENRDEFSFYYIPPHLTEWLFVFIVDELVTVNITLRDEIFHI